MSIRILRYVATGINYIMAKKKKKSLDHKIFFDYWYLRKSKQI